MKYVRTENRKYHIIYKTTCMVTGKWYIGMHSTDNLDDGYMGSGTVISRSIKKYGKENHKIEILEFVKSRSELQIREEQILTKELRQNPLCMNIRSGGTGNAPFTALTEETKAKMSVSLKRMWAELKASGFKRPKQTPEVIAKRAEKNRGKIRTAETKQLMSKSIKMAFATEDPSIKADRIKRAAETNSKMWVIDTPDGEIRVSNLNQFAKKCSLSPRKLYGTATTGKYYNGLRILRSE